MHRAITTRKTMSKADIFLSFMLTTPKICNFEKMFLYKYNHFVHLVKQNPFYIEAGELTVFVEIISFSHRLAVVQIHRAFPSIKMQVV